MKSGLKTTTFLYISLLLILCSGSVRGQNSAIGIWESHLPYNSAVGVATDGNTLFTVCNQGFFTYNNANNWEGPIPYSKSEGMADVGMQCVGYDALTSTVALGYSNGNIDLFKDKTFYNIPYYKLKTVAEAKKINQIYCDNGYAYLSATSGVIIIDLKDRTIKQTIRFKNVWSSENDIMPISSFLTTGGYYYAASIGGLYKTKTDNPAIEDIRTWANIDTVDTFKSIVTVNQQIFLATKNKVFVLRSDTAAVIYSAPTTIQHLNAGNNQLLLGVAAKSGGMIKTLSLDGAVTDSFDCGGASSQAAQLNDGSIWVAVTAGGLKKRIEGDNLELVVPQGPTDANCFDIYAHNKNVWVAHGGYNGLLGSNFNYSNLSNYTNGNWKHYTRAEDKRFDTLKDFVAIAKNEKNGALYFGSYFDGLLVMKDEQSFDVYKQNSILAAGLAWGNYARQVIGLALDKQDNLWITEMYSFPQLYALTPKGDWYSYNVSKAGYGGALVLDDSGQIWFPCLGSGGIAVYNTNGTLEDTTDDDNYYFTIGQGRGSLPSNGVHCLAKDKDNKIWMGTDKGMAVISDCHAPFNRVFEAVTPFVNFPDNSGNLLANYNVRSIAVDGANRKWVGTDKGGAWLLSPDCLTLLAHYTTGNSPLPSDNVKKISIDKVTGDIYFGTEQGMVTLRGPATDAVETNDNALLFPNPVPPGYSGSISIRGVVENADVTITDISGQLVFHTRSVGGQVVWNGQDYTGRKIQSGVYLVYITDADGKKSKVGKIAFVQ